MAVESELDAQSREQFPAIPWPSGGARPRPDRPSGLRRADGVVGREMQAARRKPVMVKQHILISKDKSNLRK
jgi:hypothetical protein